MALPPRDSDRDFSAYNAAQAGRPPRPLARRALAALRERVPAPRRPLAVDLGCGAGIESRFLAENGCEVLAIDGDPSVRPVLDALAQTLPIQVLIQRLQELKHLPDADLVLSCAALPFVPRSHWDALWARAVGSLRPGGVIAVDLFGDHDDWASAEGTYLRRDEVEAMTRDLDVIEIGEEEWDGGSFSGRKHWHTYQVIARRR
ncbi:class I SAM-dependent methyltransferase [Brachybacterium sp. NBEC-018]|uniref:class I SAM-dependent methyltransferase n=1 Tax=Brachybacterium sp. NBEC-018 TaxID=2996004 RepID=UPI002175181E|nr:class I SAM-dependent methyltransferase [Brachybacterium sp. NBEC-018]UVY85375.1 class I SAM-dependent methyltransferase [Brachybacterium sp. NBEC-018]